MRYGVSVIAAPARLAHNFCEWISVGVLLTTRRRCIGGHNTRTLLVIKASRAELLLVIESGAVDYNMKSMVVMRHIHNGKSRQRKRNRNGKRNREK